MTEPALPAGQARGAAADTRAGDDFPIWHRSYGTFLSLVSKVSAMAVLTTTDIPRPSRGGRPRDPSRDGVIRAAILRLLADVGYGALTMDAVAAEAGVGKATIYRRWRTKQDLVVDTISDLNREVASPADTGSLEGDLRAMMRSCHSITKQVGISLAHPPCGPAMGGYGDDPTKVVG